MNLPCKIRVLVVDDSVVVRKIISDVLASDPAIEIAGFAPTGKIALAKLDQVNPDVVTLDIEMPELDGLGTLKALRRQRPNLPVIMFSTLTQHGAAATIDALTSGADDYVTKPANVGNVTDAIHQIRESLIPKIKALCANRVPRPASRPTASIAPTAAPARSHPAAAPRGPAVERRADVLAIGTSTGGPNALNDLLGALPKNLPVPVVIVQHMPPMFTRMLSEHLTNKTLIPTCESAGTEVLRAGHACLAPGGRHMIVVKNGGEIVTRLNDDPPENSCRPAVDVLFRSVAEAFGEHSLGVVLTGMGHDGLRGSEQIRARGGSILVQDERSSVVWGMAGAVANAGLAEAALPLDQLAAAIVRKLQTSRPSWVPLGGAVRPPASTSIPASLCR